MTTEQRGPQRTPKRTPILALRLKALNGFYMNLNRASSGVGPVYLRGFPANWAWISDGNLRCLPQALLEQALPKIASHAATRPWRSLAHKIRNVLKTLKRSAELAQLDLSPLCDQLRAACDSRWSELPGNRHRNRLAIPSTTYPFAERCLDPT